MISENLDQIFMEIKHDCLMLIREKNVDLDELSFQLGISIDSFIRKFQVRDIDFSFYLKTYDLLKEW